VVSELSIPVLKGDLLEEDLTAVERLYHPVVAASIGEPAVASPEFLELLHVREGDVLDLVHYDESHCLHAWGCGQRTLIVVEGSVHALHILH